MARLVYPRLPRCKSSSIRMPVLSCVSKHDGFNNSYNAFMQQGRWCDSSFLLPVFCTLLLSECSQDVSREHFYPLKYSSWLLCHLPNAQERSSWWRLVVCTGLQVGRVCYKKPNYISIVGLHMITFWKASYTLSRSINDSNTIYLLFSTASDHISYPSFERTI